MKLASYTLLPYGVSMRLSLYDTEMNRIAIIGEHFVSCFWSEGYNTVEDFSIELQATDEYKKKVKTDYYVGRDDRKTLMVIKTVEVRDNLIVATGKQAARVLGDVAFVGTISAGANIPTSIHTAYASSDKFPMVEISVNGPAVSYDAQISNKSFQQLCETMCKAEEVGFRAVRNNGGILVEFYQPEENPNLIFSERFGNLDFQSLTKSTANYKNYAVVLGEGEGSDRFRAYVDMTNGAQRRSLIIDAKDLQQKDGETDGSYYARLQARGIEKLLASTEVFKCAFAPLASDFGTRYDLGDVLTVLLPDHGIKIQARVSRFTQISQKNITETSVEVGNIIGLR